MTKSKNAHPTQGAAPVIDRSAEEAEIVQQGAAPAPAPEDAGDAPMPTAENAPPCRFKPGNGVTTLDLLEINLMYLLQISGNAVDVAPGALRTLLMDATRVSQLSPEAQRWMQPVA